MVKTTNQGRQTWMRCGTCLFFGDRLCFRSPRTISKTEVEFCGSWTCSVCCKPWWCDSEWDYSDTVRYRQHELYNHVGCFREGEE
jgi:hypothetical protein